MVTGSSQMSSLLCVAVIASAHGVRGHVKVKCFLEEPSHLKDYSPYANETGEDAYKIKKILSQNKDTLIVSLEGITDRNQAEHLKGAKLMLPRERLPNLDEDIFYHSDLIGLSVKSFKGQPLGKVQALYNFGAGDLLEIKTLQGDLQIVPFRQDMVPEVDLKNHVLHLSDEAEVFLKGDKDVS